MFHSLASSKIGNFENCEQDPGYSNLFNQSRSWIFEFVQPIESAVYRKNPNISEINNLTMPKNKQAAQQTKKSKFAHISLNKPVLSLKDISPSDQTELFLQHLKICEDVFNADDICGVGGSDGIRLIGAVVSGVGVESSHLETGRQMRHDQCARKAEILEGLVEHILKPTTIIKESQFPEVFSMISANIFRSLPSRIDLLADFDEDEPVFDCTWPHLHIVYEFVLQFVVSSNVDAKELQSHISQRFLLKLLGLFESNDPREREYLKSILHRIYGKCMGLRTFIRQCMTNVLLASTYIDQHSNGIAELLEIMGSIIDGFAIPLKAEHKRFLNRGLMPLHKVKSIMSFHSQLSYCVTKYIEKERELASPIVLGLLKVWPEINSPKQVLFLQELEEVLELTSCEDFEPLIPPLMKRLSQCMESKHFHVAERALMVCSNENVFTLLAQNLREVLPHLFKVLKLNSDGHWNAIVQNLSEKVLELFRTLSEGLCDEIGKATIEDMKRQEVLLQKRASRWEDLRIIADNPSDDGIVVLSTD